MSNIVSSNHQVGQNATASLNITLNTDTNGDLVINKGVYPTLTEISRFPNAGGGQEYLPAGDGAVATTVQTKLRESVSVLDFGADPTGVSDSTSAIQAALDSGYYDIYIPAGSYKITSELVINTNGIWLRGAGAERTKIIQATAGANGITSNTAIDRLLWCELSDFRVEMPGGTTGNGIWIRNPEIFTGRHLRVTTLSGTKTLGYGIIVEKESVTDYGYYVLLEHSHIDKCNIGVYVTGQSPGGANGNWCEKVISNNNTSYGFHIRNNAGSFLSNCAAEENEHNVYLEGGGYVWVTNGRFERPDTHNIYVGNGAAFKVQNCLLASAGNVNTATGRGVYVAAGQFGEITGNTFQDGFSSYDIEIVAGSLQTVILDNKARNTASGWDVGGPRVLNGGTGTLQRHLVNTASGASIRHQSTERFDSGTILIGTAATGVYSGTGSPEATVTADTGSMGESGSRPM